MTTSGLLTDRYELTMVDAALRSGAAERRCVFEVFARSLPLRRRYAVVAGPGVSVDALADFRLSEEDLAFLTGARVIDDATPRMAGVAPGSRARSTPTQMARSTSRAPQSSPLKAASPSASSSKHSCCPSLIH